MKKIILLIICLILVEYLIEPVDSRINKGGKSRKDKKEKKEESEEEKDNEEEDITEDLKNLEPNATMSCYKCSSSSCTQTKIDCMPSQICWKGKTIEGEYKGCASRQCIPVDDYSNATEIASNICCVSDYCNSANKIHHFLSLIPFLSLFIKSFFFK